MHAVVISESTLTLSERDTATPQSGDVIVAMAGAGLNAADLLQRAGFYPAPAGWPADIPGLEVSGTVVALGDQVPRHVSCGIECQGAIFLEGGDHRG